jgi:5-methyltetrahydropteroyltriglutamate--homocysteine methyltransferase
MARQHMSDIAGRLFPTSFVGSYPRPSWFDYNLRERDVVAALREEEFAEAYRDGIRAQLGDQEEAGLDVLADPHLWYDKHQGFIASFVLYNAQRFDGVETRLQPNPLMAQMAQAPEMANMMEVFDAIANLSVAIVGPLGRGRLHHAVNWGLAQRCTTKPVKAFFAVGPVEQSMTMIDEHYHDRRALLRDLADIYHAELQDAVNAGAKIVELDDLIFVAPQDEWAFDVEILNRVFDGIDAYRIWHCCHGGTPAPIGMAPYEALFPIVKDLQCESFDWSFAQTGFPDAQLQLFGTPGFDKDLGLGVISNKNYLIETPQEVAAGVRTAMQYVAPERIHLTSDCGLFAYSRPAAKAKLRAMARGAELARQELGVKQPVGSSV